MNNDRINDVSDNWGNADSDQRYKPTALDITKENKWIYLIGVLALAMVVVASVIGVIYLANNEKEIPQALIALGSVAVGALASLFSNSSR